jgi:hypothetical protein
MSAITSLSANGIKTICECENHQAQLRDQYFTLQVTDVKVFTAADNKKNIKSRYKLY